MPTLDVISVNIWQIIISLCNLALLYVILRKFLYRPVKKMMTERQKKIDRQYADAEQAQEAANADKRKWEEKLSSADAEKKVILDNAILRAEQVGDGIVSEAERKADMIVEQAKREAEAEKAKAQDEVKTKIVELSSILSEKMLQREINADDHRALIDEFIEEVDEDADGD
ncbi:MAG: F0F1 ATP synthase subunit B [Clostridia bacterium]|nr:F0F1 ATP synthase subunit B [Clostridia bacterium]